MGLGQGTPGGGWRVQGVERKAGTQSRPQDVFKVPRWLRSTEEEVHCSDPLVSPEALDSGSASQLQKLCFIFSFSGISKRL